MKRLARFLNATVRRLRMIARVLCHFVRSGKLESKLAIRNPFFVEVKVRPGHDGKHRR